MVSKRIKASNTSIDFQIGDQLCTQCRKKFAELQSRDDSDQFDEEDLGDPGHDSLSVASVQRECNIPDDDFVSPEVELSELNQSLSVLGESPVVKQKVYTQVKYAHEKVKSIHASVKRKLELISGNIIPDNIIGETRTRTRNKKTVLNQKL